MILKAAGIFISAVCGILPLPEYLVLVMLKSVS